MQEVKTNSQKLAIAAYIIVCIIWGSTYLAIRIAVKDLPPMISAGIRFVSAGLIMFGYASFKQRPSPKKEQVKHQSIVGLILLLGGNGMVVLGSQWVHSSIAALLFATVPLFIAVEELLLPGGEKLTKIGWLGLFIGFGGVAFLVFAGQESLGIQLKGAMILLLGALFWASGSVYSKRVKSEGAIEFNLAIQMLTGGLGLLIVGVLLGEAKYMSLSLSGMLAILYLIVFGSLLGYNAYIYLLSVWPATRAGTYTYINPFVAMFLGYIVLNEPLNSYNFLGTAIILFGVFLVQFADAKAEKI